MNVTAVVSSYLSFLPGKPHAEMLLEIGDFNAYSC
jgi:hypothetical protein